VYICNALFSMILQGCFNRQLGKSIHCQSNSSFCSSLQKLWVPCFYILWWYSGISKWHRLTHMVWMQKIKCIPLSNQPCFCLPLFYLPLCRLA